MAKKYNYTKKPGRPTKFKKRYIQDLINFFDMEPQRKEVMKVVTEYDRDGKPKKTAEEYKFVPNRMPTIYQFAKKIKVAYMTVWTWAEKGEDEELNKYLASADAIQEEILEERKLMKEFSYAYKTAKAAQQEFLMDIGLSGAAPSAAYIFTAKNITGMRDKIENNVTVREVKPLLENLVLDTSLDQKAKAEAEGS